MARTSAELTPEEILIIGDLVPVGSPGQVPTVNAGGTGLEYKTPTGGDALTSNPLSQFASTTSAQLAGVISDETGSGSLVFATSPTLVTPVLGAATATSINGATITSGTLNGSVTGTNTGDQTVANTSNATSHTVTLSATGGSVRLVEGSGITLTTTGTSADGIVTIASTGGGSGDVVGPASATDNAVARFDSTTGKLIQNSSVTIDDYGTISGGSLSTTGNVNVNGTTEAALKTNGGIRMAGSSVRGVYDNSLNELIKFPLTDVASAVNEFTIKNAATTTGPILEATGGDTNIDININPKGTGRIKSGTVAVPTISSTDTLTNKTIALGSNTLTGTLSQFNTACTDADFATGGGTATGTNTGDNATNTTSDAYALTTPAFWQYSISRTVSTGNMTVAVKNYLGNDPSPTVPIYVMIGGVMRTITSALSFTSSAGFNWLNLGSTEIATKEVDLFTYFIWRSGESAVRLTASRFPTATTYNDFNSDALNEKGNLGNFASPVSTDPVVNIGRFNAILSGGAGYTWSIPATSVVINSPIYETRWLTGGYSNIGMTTQPNIITYKISNNSMFLLIDGGGTSNSTSWSLRTPFSQTGPVIDFSTGVIQDNGANKTSPGRCDFYGNTIDIYSNADVGTFTASGNKFIRASCICQI